jgi:hypothetical protein
MEGLRMKIKARGYKIQDYNFLRKQNANIMKICLILTLSTKRGNSAQPGRANILLMIC